MLEFVFSRTNYECDTPLCGNCVTIMESPSQGVRSWQDEKLGRILNVNVLLLESENVWRVPASFSTQEQAWRRTLMERLAVAHACSHWVRLGHHYGFPLVASSVASHVILLPSLESLPSFSPLVSHI